MEESGLQKLIEDGFKMDKRILKLRCDWLLTAMVGKAMVESWWNSPNKHWEMKLPKDVFEDTPEDVYNYLMFHANGPY